jgi:hypothetical protein
MSEGTGGFCPLIAGTVPRLRWADALSIDQAHSMSTNATIWVLQVNTFPLLP